MLPPYETVRAGVEAELARGPLLLDGALGTELLRRGVPTPMPLWATQALVDDPEAVAQIHADYVQAGVRSFCSGFLFNFKFF